MQEIQELSNKQFIILTGEFGSGKSELAVNCALREQRALADLDIAKPMNGSRDFRDLLTDAGLEVIAIPRQFENLEVRMLPQMLPRLIAGSNRAVFDVGGGDSAVVIGQFSGAFNADNSDVMLVVNTFRPFSQTTAEIVAEKRSVEERTGLIITRIICNCNLAEATDLSVAVAGIETVSAAANELSLPLHCVVLPDWLRSEVAAPEYPVYYLHRHFNYVR